MIRLDGAFANSSIDELLLAVLPYLNLAARDGCLSCPVRELDQTDCDQRGKLRV
jgi:hypothetical protein